MTKKAASKKIDDLAKKISKKVSNQKKTSIVEAVRRIRYASAGS